MWESDSASFAISEDPRGNTLGRGTQISLHLKEEAFDFLEPDTLKKLVNKYSQFINFDIFMWQSRTEKEEVPVEEGEEESKDKKKDEDKSAEEEEKEEGTVEEVSVHSINSHTI